MSQTTDEPNQTPSKPKEIPVEVTVGKIMEI
jgi:hypothetical protein